MRTLRRLVGRRLQRIEQERERVRFLSQQGIEAREAEERYSTWIPYPAYPKQKIASQYPDELELFYGGSVASGKTDWLLREAIGDPEVFGRHLIEIPGYAALLIRRTYPQLAGEDGLIARSKEWAALCKWRERGARYSETRHQWTFPCPGGGAATLRFGHMATEQSKHEYDGFRYHLIGFDELTHFTRTQYTYMFSRLGRRRPDSELPDARMRSTGMPGNVGHAWVKNRFVDELTNEGRRFIPARLEDNPAIDREEYERSLEQLDPVERQRKRKGDWEIEEAGKMFARVMFKDKIIDPSEVPKRGIRWLRYWDLAATEPHEKNPEPAYTCGLKMGTNNEGTYWVRDVRRMRKAPGEVESLVKITAQLDDYEVAVRMEEEPGSSGKNTIYHYGKNVLDGYDFKGRKETGSKVNRAQPFSAACSRGDVYIVKGDWNDDYLSELEAFPNAAAKDQVDASSGAFAELSRKKRPPKARGGPRRRTASVRSSF